MKPKGLRTMEIKNGTLYNSNYARAAAYFLGTCAPFPEGGSEQWQATYDFITGIYQKMIQDASSLGFKPVSDVYFAPWEQQKAREKDVKSIRTPIKKIEELIKKLFELTGSSQISGDMMVMSQESAMPRGIFLKMLTNCGVVIQKDEQTKLIFPAGVAQGLMELAHISRANTISITEGPQEDKNYLFFSRCVFNPSQNWTATCFDKLLGAEGRLMKLCEALEKRGYKRVNCFDGKKISLDYVKQHGKKQEPLKGAWAERSYTGISVSFEELRLEPAFLWLRMPMFKTVLQSAERLPQNVRDFIGVHTKSCDGCRYCVQTDKTGTRPLAAITLGEKKKCPIFPGFTMNWRELSHELADNIVETLEALDEILER